MKTPEYHLIEIMGKVYLASSKYVTTTNLNYTIVFSGSHTECMAELTKEFKQKYEGHRVTDSTPPHATTRSYSSIG